MNKPLGESTMKVTLEMNETQANVLRVAIIAQANKEQKRAIKFSMMGSEQLAEYHRKQYLFLMDTWSVLVNQNIDAG